MSDYNVDSDKNLRTVFLIALFSLFVIAFSDIHGNHSSPSSGYYSQNELRIGGISSHCNAVLSIPFSLPELQKYCECTLRNTSLISFSIHYKASDYNRRLDQTFILIQKTRLTIEPVPYRLYLNLPSNKDDDLPVIS
jgi:hypothetical protein